MRLSTWLCFLVIIIKLTYAQYNIPEIQFEAYTPAGFKASLKAVPGVELFAFHGKLNQNFEQIVPGDFTDDIKRPKNGSFVYFNPSLRLKVGDVIHYWVFVQHNQLGFKLDNQQWTVKELLPLDGQNSCKQSKTISSDQQQTCSGSIIFQDEFNNNSLDITKWIWEQYIPAEPDYEFVIYTKDKTVTTIQNNQLTIKPKLQSEQELNEKLLDLSNGCTNQTYIRATNVSYIKAKCISGLYLIQNPIVSGRIVTTKTFSYGDVEVKAKLPSGDWMYTQMYLEGIDNKKLILAYARGNKILKGNDNIDIGGSLLFGGPMYDDKEPDRSKSLSSYRHTQYLSNDFHVYKLKWAPDKLQLFFDGKLFGTISKEILNVSGFGTNPLKTRLVIGVGVGGLTDFPDDYQYSYPKPWRNKQRYQMKMFYDARDQWLPSWNTGGALIVDYVRIKAI